MSGISFERLPPERAAVVAPVAAAGGCCCCCCCCLHTVGGLIGAVSTKAPVVDLTTAPPTAVVGTTKVEPKYSIARDYWLTLFLVCSVATPLVLAVTGEDLSRGHEWFWLFAILLPAFQLGASLVLAIMTSMSKRPGRRERQDHLARITVRAFLGGMIGIVIMVVVGSAL
ncbi:MAG: hypothetical protein M3680_32315 [Myxococcota bacterium]|nr:hypothetical protein [Myxococcota bacterium]